MHIPYNILLAAVTLLIARAQDVKAELEQIDSKDNNSQPHLLPSLRGLNASIGDVLKTEIAIKNARRLSDDPVFKFLDDIAKNRTQSLESVPQSDFLFAKANAKAKTGGKKKTHAPTTSADGYGVNAASEIPCDLIGTVYIDDCSRAAEKIAAANYYKQYGTSIMYNGKKIEITFLMVWKFNPTITPRSKNYMAYTIVPKGTDLQVKPIKPKKGLRI